MNRTDIFKGLTLLPLGSAVSLASQQVFAGAGMAGPGGGLKPVPQIFHSLGVEPLINCMGTYTIIGGSLERPAVRAAMDAASRNFVQYDELSEGVAKRLAEITGAEWGMVSAGCAAGLKHVTAACVTGGNPEKLIRIPNLAGFEKTEVVVPRSARNVYDHAIRNVGVTIINVGSLKEMASALGPRTAMVYLMAEDTGEFTIEAVASLTKALKIPILVDAAAEDLTVPCIHLQKGASVVAYSGGKALCGPQCSGILLGQKSILQSAWQASSPHHGPGRDNKVGREEMIGALAAVEAWVTMDHKAKWKNWLSYLDHVAQKLKPIASLQTAVREPEGLSDHSPALVISWDPSALNITGQEVAEELGRNKPRIALSAERNAGKTGLTSISVTAGQMQSGEDKIVAERLYSLLSAKREPKSLAMKPPAVDLTGRWEVEVSFYSSKCSYTWSLQQDGNWITGTHTGTFSTQNIAGSIEHTETKLRTSENQPGDRLAFTFTGDVSGDHMTGTVYLVEYGRATFTASRYKYKEARQKLSVPGGPPLAT